MLSRMALGLVGLLAVSPLGAQTAAPSDSLLGHLIGHWVLRGPMAGKSVVHDVTFAWVLGTEYVECTRCRASGRQRARRPTKPSCIWVAIRTRTNMRRCGSTTRRTERSHRP